MAQWEDYAGDEWLRPLASQDTRTKEPRDGDTRGLKPRPRLQPPPFQPGDRWGDFVLEKWIGSGSHGWVFSARNHATDKPVALKILADTEEPETTMAKTGFRRMAKLRHRHLMHLDRIHESEQGVAFSMERIDGINLTAAIRKWRSLPLQQACDHLIEMVRQMGSAIGWMHARQLVHRDLKPSNIMVTHDESRFVLIDYDLTGTFDPEVDSEAMRSYLVWTPMYVAPEVLVRQRHSPSSDVFSLGMVVLEALRVFSAAQWERESSERETPPSATPTINREDFAAASDETIPRDRSDSDQDQQLIHDAVRGLHPDAPEILTDALSEMLSPLESDRPMAMTLSRLGMPLTTLQMTRITDVDSGRLRDSTQKLRHTELAGVHRWSHLVLGGAVQRLHIEGESGIGKSSLLDVALTRLRSQPWAQVFVARCQQRDQKPLQAFSQIADEITMRFRTMDREMLQVDSVTESLLTHILPGLAEVLEVDWSQPRLETSPTRPGGLEAAMKVCERLREYGPVFFVVDDVQWADRDTISTLDYLQSASLSRPGLPALQGFGLITVSRPDGDQQVTLPDQTIRVGRLPDETTSELLLDEAAKHSLALSPRQTTDLAREIDGLPYRLDAYLEEIRLGTLFDKATFDPAKSSESTVPTMESLWQRHCAELDPAELRWLQRIAAAGRQVHVDELHGWGDDLDGVQSASRLESLLDQLQANRLIVREGLTGEMIRIWHARLGEQVLASLDEQSIRQLHAWWAETLSQVRPELANIITSHYLQAEIHGPVAHWATLAAGQAQRMYAHREVAWWHRIAAKYSKGEAKCESLRSVADAFHRSGSIREAAEVHAELASLLDGPAKLEHEFKHVECLVRSGEFRDLGSQLQPLIERLRMPRPKSAWAFKLSCAWRLIRLMSLRQNIADWSRETSLNRSPEDAFRLQACVRLIQPMSIIKNDLATEWALFAARQVRLHGTVGERIQLGVGEAVFGSYQPGRMRTKSAAILTQMQEQLRPDDDPFWHATVHCGLGWAAIMDGRHEESIHAWLESKRFYAMSEQLANFELAHMAYGELQAYWQTGKLQSLRRVAGEMLAEGGTTNDQFVLIMGTLGAGSIAFLAADDLTRLDAAERGVRDCLQRVGPDSFGFIQSYRNAFTTLYQRDLSHAMTQLEWLPRALRRSPVLRVQMIRVALRELMTLMSMQAMQEDANHDARRAFQRLTRLLRRERLPLATMKANLFEGTVLARSAKSAEREMGGEMLIQAREVAEALQLTPNVLAAEDELRWLNQPAASSSLEDFLADQNVVSPKQMARIYRGVDRPSDHHRA